MQIIFHCCTLYIYNCRCKRERGSSTPLTAASFCARGALRGAWYAPSTQLYAPICTQPARSTRPRCTSPPLRRARPGLHPGLQHPPGLCRDDRRHAAASLSPGTRTAPAVNERHGRLARGSEGSSTRGGGRRGNDRGFWRHQRQWMECKTRFSLKI